MTQRSITFTFDLEDHRPSESLPKRYPEMTDRLLVFLKQRNIKGTIFVVGKLAETDPGIVKRVADAGHEIALHSYDHTPLTRQTPQEFMQHTKKAKDIIEDVIGQEVIGYRAPVFSLTRDSLWAVDIMKDLGLTYSSSILPATNPLYGLPDLTSSIFKWSNGLLEIPSPVGRIGPFLMPYLGGFYFRYLPEFLIRKQIQNAANDEVLWTYWHPYDFDHKEKNFRIKDAALWVSLLLWFNRKNTFSKLEKLTHEPGIDFAKPFKELISEGLFNNVTKTINPNTLLKQ